MWATFRTLQAKRRTLEAAFQDKRSRIGYRPDGSEFWDLCGRDMGIMRNRVFIRDKMICQVCGMMLMLSECELHHVRSRGKGGDDQIENLACICRRCHQKAHVQVRWTAQLAGAGRE